MTDIKMPTPLQAICNIQAGVADEQPWVPNGTFKRMMQRELALVGEGNVMATAKSDLKKVALWLNNEGWDYDGARNGVEMYSALIEGAEVNVASDIGKDLKAYIKQDAKTVTVTFTLMTKAESKIMNDKMNS